MPAELRLRRGEPERLHRHRQREHRRGKGKLKTLAEEKERLAAEIAAEAPHREELELAFDRMGTRIAMAEAEERLYGTESTLVLEGWAPAEREEELDSSCWRATTVPGRSASPAEEEYPEVPVKLKNNKFSNALNMVTNMYSLPAYGTVDPNPIMAPFFILFYGLMMADMGYGLIMIAAALVAMKKIKPRGGTLAFCQLLLYGGISTFIMGALTGGFFGNAPAVIAGMFGSTWKGLPALFSPVEDSRLVLYGAMVLGVIHLNVGMIVSFLEKKRAGKLLDGVFEEGPLWVILLGGVLMGLQMLVLKDLTILKTIGLAILIVGAVMLLYGAGRHAKGFGKVTAAFGIIYNTLTGWFGDILSYSRIMALMLAGGVVAQVFNTIAAMPSAKGGVTVFSGIIFLIIFLIGHALNFGLNLLGCFVHDLRLQCLEFFGKFYQDGGKPFQPLRIRGKYAVPERGKSEEVKKEDGAAISHPEGPWAPLPGVISGSGSRSPAEDSPRRGGNKELLIQKYLGGNQHEFSGNFRRLRSRPAGRRSGGIHGGHRLRQRHRHRR